jgi:hypothetical protein
LIKKENPDRIVRPGLHHQEDDGSAAQLFFSSFFIV